MLVVVFYFSAAQTAYLEQFSSRELKEYPFPYQSTNHKIIIRIKIIRIIIRITGRIMALVTIKTSTRRAKVRGMRLI